MKYMKLASTILILALSGVGVARGQNSPAPSEQGSSPTQPAATAPDQAAPAPGQMTQGANAASSNQAAAPSEKAAATPESHPVDWAPRQYVEMWNTGDISPEHQNAIFNNTVIMHSNNGDRLVLNAPRVAQVISSWRRSMPDLHFTIDDTIIQGNKVVLRTSFTGTYTKILFANTEDPAKFPAPRKIHDGEILIFSVRNGKIEEMWENYNETRMRSPMGSSWCTAEQRKPLAPPAPTEAPSANSPPSTPDGKP
jgi:predicted ester cyclase